VSLEEFRATRQWSEDLSFETEDIDLSGHPGYVYDWGGRTLFIELLEGGRYWTLMTSEDMAHVSLDADYVVGLFTSKRYDSDKTVVWRP
jgi:hypothetical protein